MGKGYHLFLGIAAFGFLRYQSFLLLTSFKDFLFRAFPHAQCLQQNHARGIGNAGAIFIECNVEDDTAKICRLDGSGGYVTSPASIFRVNKSVKLLTQISPDVLILRGKVWSNRGKFQLLPFAVPSLPLCIAECHIFCLRRNECESLYPSVIGMRAATGNIMMSLRTICLPACYAQTVT